MCNDNKDSIQGQFIIQQVHVNVNLTTFVYMVQMRGWTQKAARLTN